MAQIKTRKGVSRSRQELADSLRGAIESGVYCPGYVLPTEAELVKKHGLSRHSVRVAMQELVSEGLISRTPGQGTVVVRRKMRSRRVSLVVQEPREWLAGSIAHGLADAFRDSHIRLELATSGDDQEDFDCVIDGLIEHGCDGVVVSPLPWLRNHEWAFRLKQAGIPFVLVNEPIEGVDVPSACMANRLGGQLAAEHLLDCGYRRLFVVTPDSVSTTIRHRRDGFMSAAVESGLACSCLPVFISLDLDDKRDHNQPWRAAQRVWKNLLEQDRFDMPIGVFAISDIEAYGVCQACKDHGLQIGSDVGVIGFDDRELSRVSDPQISTIRNMPEEMGKKAAELILRQLDRNYLQGETVVDDLILPELIARDSTVRVS